MTPKQTPAITVATDEMTGAAMGHPPGWERLSGALSSITLAWPESELPAETFRPNAVLTVEPAPTGPDPIQTVSHQIMTGLLAAIPGIHLISLDVVTLRGGHDGRRLIAVYRQPPFVVQLTQYWTIVDGVTTSLSVSCGIEQTTLLAPSFDYCLGLLEPATRLPEHPPIAPLPPVTLDADALRTGWRLEHLAWIPSAQPYRRSGPRLTAAGWSLLETSLTNPVRPEHLDVPARDDLGVLIRHSLMTADGGLTETGRTIAQTLHEPVTTIRVEANRHGRRHLLRLALDTRQAIVLASASPALPADAAEVDQEQTSLLTLDVTEASATPAVIASWTGLAPAWFLAPPPEALAKDRFTARCDDPVTPVPPDADAFLSLLWAQPWVLWGLHVDHRGPGTTTDPSAQQNTDLLVLQAGPRGTYLVSERAPSSADAAHHEAALTMDVAPTAALWEHLKAVTL